MWDILHSFGAGIAFAVGVTIGAILCQLSTRKGREITAAEFKEHRETVETRLLLSLRCHERMANAAEAIAAPKSGKKKA